MDVACARCQSEYEFDDALISSLGTTVFCTNCGHRFKIFPDAEAEHLERWTLAREGGELVHFESLRELQMAIAHGEVAAEDRLCRGAGDFRPIGEIVELAPLVKQLRSVPPPRVGPSSLPLDSDARQEMRVAERLEEQAESEAEAPWEDAIGLAPPRLPNVELTSAAFSDETEGGVPERDDAEAVVPASPGAPEDPPQEPARGSDRPRVFSMLSTPEPGSASRASPPPLEAMAPPVTPRITPRKRSARPEFLTPTPPLSSRLSLVDSEPISKVPGTYRGRGARGVWLLLAVLGGAGAFLFLTAKDKLPRFFGATEVIEDEDEEQRVARLLASAREVQAAAEEAWLGLRLETPGQEEEAGDGVDRRVLEQSLEFRLRTLSDLLEQLRPLKLSPAARAEFQSERVHLFRMHGDLNRAREVVAEAADEELPDTYSLAMLDLAEEAEERPFSIILSRLKEASTGERGRFLVRSAYIYAQIAAGRFEQARSDLAAMSQLKGGKAAPLYGALESFLAAEQRRAEGALEP